MNQRERLTKLLLNQALISLLKDKSIGQISVKEICSTAGINRSTFYLHYASSFELLEKLEQEIIHNTSEYLKKIEPSNKDGVRYIMSFLDYIKKNDALFKVMLLKSNDTMLFPQRLINGVLKNIDSYLQLNVPDKFKQYTYAYLVNGSLAIIQEWIKDGFSVSSLELAQLIFSLANHSLVSFDK
ncbi:DNA-binding transcriptional repressor FabR [compost metagenome]